MNIEFSIILPIYNQEDQIIKIYDAYSKILEQANISFELIFVVNGSSDGSLKIAESIQEKDTRVKAFYTSKSGWGLAVKYGIQQSVGEKICYTNSARTAAKDLLLVLKYAQVNKDNIVKANRILRESYIRSAGSIIFNLENRFFFRTPIWDVNGTPKVIPAQILKNIDIVSDGDLLDAELIAKVFKSKHLVIEIPILSTTRLSGKSTTNLLSAFNMYFGLISLRRIIKKYQKNV